MDNERQYVMLDLTFNMGIEKLSKFKDTLKDMQEGDYDKAAENLKKSNYFRQTGNRAARNYVGLKTGIYVPEVTKKTIDITILKLEKLKDTKSKTTQDTKKIIQKDQKKYKQVVKVDKQSKKVYRLGAPGKQMNQLKEVVSKLEAPDNSQKQDKQPQTVYGFEPPDNQKIVYELRNTDNKEKQTGVVYELRNTDNKEKQTKKVVAKINGADNGFLGLGILTKKTSKSKTTEESGKTAGKRVVKLVGPKNGVFGVRETKSAMKNSVEKCKEKLKSMIAAMDKNNKGGKAIDGDKAAEILYDKYGNDAQKKLYEAMTAPRKYGKENGDDSIKTSSAAVEHLIKTAKLKGRA